jgi:hypothetical protein
MLSAAASCQMAGTAENGTTPTQKRFIVADHATTTEPTVDAHASAAVTSPEFDLQEVRSFGADDGHAVTVIGKMLVGFFFYSLLVMALVAAWTIWGFGQTQHDAGDSHHAADTADF